jgi:hypothetical protein
MSSKESLAAFGSAVFLIAVCSSTVVGCGGASPAAAGKDGGAGSSAAAGSAGGDQSGTGGDMTGTAGAMAGGTGGDMSGGTGGMIGGAGMTGTAGMGGAAGAGGNGGAAGKGGTAGAGGRMGTRDAGVSDAGGALTACRHATTCTAGDPPCLKACAAGGDATCECGTGALAGKLVCETVCERPDAGGATDAGATRACVATIKSGTTACTPRTESTCETACQNMEHRECTCVATAGTRGVWFCFKPTACQ